MRKKRLSRDKQAIEIEMIGWWVIALGVLVIMGLGYLILSGKLSGAIGYVKDLFRFGGG